MLQSRLKAKHLGSVGPHAKSNCIDARQTKLSVNKSLSTETCFSLTNIICCRPRQSYWKVWYREILISLVFQGRVSVLDTITQQLVSTEELVISIWSRAVWRPITVKQFVAAGDECMNTHLHAPGCRESWDPGPGWAGTQRCGPAANRTACTPHQLTCCLRKHEEIKEHSFLDD